MQNSFKFYLTAFLMIVPSILWANPIISNCLSSFLLFKPDAIYLRPGFPVKKIQDPRRNIVAATVGGDCKLLGATDVSLQLDDGKVIAFELILAPSYGVIFPLLPPPVQMSISSQLAQGLNVPITVSLPIPSLDMDQSGFLYRVIYKNKIFNEVIIWQQFSLGVSDEIK